MLVVVEDPHVDRLELQAVEQRMPERRMGANDALLVRRQPARLLQDLVGDPDLAEVVQQTRDPDLLDELLAEPELLGDALDEARHRLRVLTRVGVLDVDGADEVLGGLETCLARRKLRQLLGREGADDGWIEEKQPILPVLLRPVERTVDRPLEGLTVVGIPWEDADTDADRHGGAERRTSSSTMPIRNSCTNSAAASPSQSRRSANSSPPSRKARAPPSGEACRKLAAGSQSPP